MSNQIDKLPTFRINSVDDDGIFEDEGNVYDNTNNLSNTQDSNIFPLSDLVETTPEVTIPFSSTLWETAKHGRLAYTQQIYDPNLDKRQIDINAELSNKIDNTISESKVQQLIDTAVANIDKLTKKIVTSLPATGEDNIIYLILKSNDPNNSNNLTSVNDIYNEYIWINATKKYEFIGNTAPDLSDYLSLLENKNYTLQQKQNAIDNLNLGIVLLDGDPTTAVTYTQNEIDKIKKANCILFPNSTADNNIYRYLIFKRYEVNNATYIKFYTNKTSTINSVFIYNINISTRTSSTTNGNAVPIMSLPITDTTTDNNSLVTSVTTVKALRTELLTNLQLLRDEIINNPTEKAIILYSDLTEDQDAELYAKQLENLAYIYDNMIDTDSLEVPTDRVIIIKEGQVYTVSRLMIRDAVVRLYIEHWDIRYNTKARNIIRPYFAITAEKNTLSFNEELFLTNVLTTDNIVSETGSSETKSISQKKYTEDLAELQNYVYKTLIAVTFSASPSIVEKVSTGGTNVKLTWTTKFDGAEVDYDNVTLRDNLHGSDIIMIPDNAKTVTVNNVNATTTYTLTITVKGITITKTATVTAVYPVYIGTGGAVITGEEIVALENKKVSRAATITLPTVPITEANKNYVWVCVPQPGTININTVTTDGVSSFPTASAIVVAVAGKGNYNCYRSKDAAGLTVGAQNKEFKFTISGL